MSSSDIAISVRGVSKAYTIRHQRADAPTTLAEAITRRLRNPFRRGSETEQFWALKDVSFDVKRGEVVGIIGRNGAGKSTLLKILSRITEMTTGEVDLYGRVGSLLEVGTGFHQELTGRENIFLNGAILGMTRAEIKSQFEAIVDFAGVEKFLDTPVKRYSSGMYVRLAFAVAAHLRSEILIVDEVLAVGDAEFQKKCLGKMKEVSGDGRTVLFVSHNMQSIALLCAHCVVLEAGKLLSVGTTDQAISQYRLQAAPNRTSKAQRFRPGSGEYRFSSAGVEKRSFAPDEVKTLSFEIEHVRGELGQFFPSALLVDDQGNELAQFDGRLTDCWYTDTSKMKGSLSIRHPWLKPGRYRVDLYLCTGAGIVDIFDSAVVFDVDTTLPYPSTASATAVSRGIVFPDFSWERVLSRDGQEGHARA